MAVRVVLLLVLAARIAAAQPGVPPGDPATALRDANAAATAGEWDRVAATVDPLLAHQLGRADLAEAHRLAGLAAFFHQDRDAAEFHFLAYLRLDLQGHLDPALYPPEVTSFFDEVRARHAAELRARASKTKRYWYVAPLPVASQLQNGDKTKGIVIGSLLGALAITNITSYLVLRSWCHNPGLDLRRRPLGSLPRRRAAAGRQHRVGDRPDRGRRVRRVRRGAWLSSAEPGAALEPYANPTNIGRGLRHRREFLTPRRGLQTLVTSPLHAWIDPELSSQTYGQALLVFRYPLIR